MTETVENRIDLNLPEDIQKITSPARESIYFLRSLENFFTNHVVEKDDFDQVLFNERVKKIKGCYSEFDVLENKLYFPEDPIILSDGTYRTEIELKELVKISIEYLKLKEEIDDLQLEILIYLFKVENNLISKISHNEEYLKPLVSKHIGNSFIYSAFEHSMDEDRLDNYRIFITDKKVAKKYSKEATYPIAVKIRNNDFLLKKYRNLYKIVKKTQIQLSSDISRLKEERDIQQMTIEQFKTNKKINRLTLMTTIIAVIGVIYASISTYFLLKNNNVF